MVIQSNTAQINHNQLRVNCITDNGVSPHWTKRVSPLQGDFGRLVAASLYLVGNRTAVCHDTPINLVEVGKGSGPCCHRAQKNPCMTHHAHVFTSKQWRVSFRKISARASPTVSAERCFFFSKDNVSPASDVFFCFPFLLCRPLYLRSHGRHSKSIPMN